MAEWQSLYFETQEDEVMNLIEEFMATAVMPMGYYVYPGGVSTYAANLFDATDDFLQLMSSLCRYMREKGCAGIVNASQTYAGKAKRLYVVSRNGVTHKYDCHTEMVPQVPEPKEEWDYAEQVTKIPVGKVLFRCS